MHEVAADALISQLAEQSERDAQAMFAEMEGAPAPEPQGLWEQARRSDLQLLARMIKAGKVDGAKRAEIFAVLRRRLLDPDTPKRLAHGIEKLFFEFEPGP